MPKNNSLADQQPDTPVEIAAKMLAERLKEGVNSDIETDELIRIGNALRQMDKDKVASGDQPSQMSTAQLHREIERTRERIEALS